jgi:hypothetical protein
MSPSRGVRSLGLPFAVLVVVLAIFTGAMVLSRTYFEVRKPEMPPGLTPVHPLGEDRESPLFRVTRLQGEAETLQNGQWYVVRAGQLLSTKDVLRTKSGARATLRRGSMELELPDNTDVRLEDLAQATARVGLLRGRRLSASVGNETDQLEITARNTRAQNLGAARFIVSMTEAGKVSVAAKEGSARFEAKGKAVILAPGSTSTAELNETPTDPEPIPPELLLSVIWPEDDRVVDEGFIQGRVTPSTQININGRPTDVGRDGAFSLKVALKTGKNRIQVEAEDVVGRKKTVEKTITRSVPAPILEPSGDELWNP